MLAELQKLQANTTAFAASIQSSATSTVQSRFSPETQLAFVELSHSLSATISDFSATLTAKDVPLQEKMTKIAADVREHIVPVLGSVTKVISVALAPKIELAVPEVNGMPTLPKDAHLEPKQAVHVKSEDLASDRAKVPKEERNERKTKRPEQNGKHPEADVKHRESHTKHPDTTKVSPASKEKYNRPAVPSKDKHSTYNEKSEVVSSKRGTRDHVIHTK